MSNSPPAFAFLIALVIANPGAERGGRLAQTQAPERHPAGLASKSASKTGEGKTCEKQ